MNLKTLNNISSNLNLTHRMPILFLGHGSPMNAIEDNEFVAGFRNISKNIEKPNAIICISAHWETKGTKITAMKQPKTIYDFGGFPKELYEVKYDAPGSPELASEISNFVKTTQIKLDHSWGLDHGAWSVIKHLYPSADIPVLQISLDYNMSPNEHYLLAKELNILRHKGILFIGSGNIVHNLRVADWHRIDDSQGYDWAKEADNKVKQLIYNENHNALINFDKHGIEFKLSIPTPEHFLPLLYILGMKQSEDNIEIINEKSVYGSISMTSYKFY